jgi:hypothetical protein
MSDILVSPLKMIFSLMGYVHEQFSFIIKLLKKKIFVINPNKNQPLLVQTENIEFNEVTKNMISSQPLAA